MNMHRRALLQIAILVPAIVSGSHAVAQEDFRLGRVWDVTEYGTGGRSWEGTWTRRGWSYTFDAQWRDSLSGGIVRDVIEFRGVHHGHVELYRFGNHGRYFGELSDDDRTIERGSASWYGPDEYWTARIHRHEH